MKSLAGEPKANRLITVLGATGFIGSHLVKRLGELGRNFFAPDRDEAFTQRNYGDVIYCIGVTADFRNRPFATVAAHVCHLTRVLEECDFDSLLYLSSVRVYKNSSAPAREDDALALNPAVPDDLYNISKVMGESLTLSCGKKGRVARLANVYGKNFDSPNFLSAVIAEAVTKTEVIVRNAPDAEKDYVSVGDVVDSLIKIATQGEHSIYNVASGRNLSNARLLGKIRELTGCRVTFDAAAPKVTFPAINIDRLRSEFGFRPRNLLEDLSEAIDQYRSQCLAEDAKP